LWSMRTAKRKSCQHVSRKDSQRAEANLFLRDFEIAPLQTHSAKRILAAHAVLHLFFSRHVEETAELFIQLPFDAFLSEQ